MSADARAYVSVRVVPRAARERLVRDPAGGLRAYLTAAPVDGAANRALIALVATRLGVAKRAVELARGERSRDKLLCVHGLSADVIESRLRSGVDKATGRS
ncbi:MAG TPA: DUF167 domain-containing protein [Candidatus Binatia bacterium]|jgi:hypothetical protein